MLQFATDGGLTLTQKEQVAIALEGGCGWIRLTSSDDIEEIAKVCEKQGVMLVLDDDVATVDRLRIHGLHLTTWDRGQVIATREQLGPHAVLGLTFPIDGDPEQLRALDIDYITIPKPDSEEYLQQYARLVEMLRKAAPDLHPVASGNFAIEALRPLIAAGIAGVEVSGSILTNPMPIQLIRSMIEALSDARNGSNTGNS